MRMEYLGLGLQFFFWKEFSRIRYGNERWVKLDWGQLFVDCNDFRSFLIAKEKGTQKEKVYHLKKLVELKPDIFIDVGANYGEFTCSIADMGILCIVIEANPKLKKYLDISFRKSNVKIFNCAIAENEEKMKFYINTDYSGGSSFNKKVTSSNLLAGQKNVREVLVDSIPLDHLILDQQKLSPKSIILKIDVESFELEVLRSATKLLELCNWWRAIIEFNPVDLTLRGKDHKIVWDIYRKYKGFVISNNVISLKKLQLLEDELPREPPFNTCDVLIGQGKISLKKYD